MRRDLTNGENLATFIGVLFLIAAPFTAHFFGLYTGAIQTIAGTVLAVWFSRSCS